MLHLKLAPESSRPTGAFRASALLIAAPLLSLCLLSSDVSAAQLFDADSSITGRIRDMGGAPLAGALVSVQSSGEALRERLAVTDRSGLFTIDGLTAGEYLLRVTKARFLPTVANGVEVEAGSKLVMTLNLQTALDVIRQGVRRGSMEDMKWVLRSSPSARPVLHLADAGTTAPPSTDTAGFVQVYSTAVESGVGVGDTFGSEFAYSLPVSSDAIVTFAGQYTEAPDKPSGFVAAYDFSSGDRRRTSVAVNVRQGALLNSFHGSAAREVQLGYDEQIHWSDNLVLTYGAAVGYTDSVGAGNYIRPEVGVTWVRGPGSSISAEFSRRSPIDASDPIRGREYFDRAVYVPSQPEEYSHAELRATHSFANEFRLSLAGFRDESGSQAYLVDADDGRRGLVFLDVAAAPTAGVRVFMDRNFRGLEAGLGYTYANAVAFDPDVLSPEDLYEDANRRNLHVVTARVSTNIEWSQTAVTAVYRWVSGFPLAPVDPYQRTAEYNDPTLSITVAQDLPSLKILPAKFQAIVDARNLFEPSFGSRRTVFAGHPRLLKGGIHIRF